jgi:hypothetical protein
MAARKDPIPAWPFAEWLTSRVAFWLPRVGGSGQDAALRHVAGECGWMGDSGLRMLYRFRYQQRSTSTPLGARGRFKKTDVYTTTFPRETVEEALHHAGVDFYDLHIEYAHRCEGERARPRDVLDFIAAYEPIVDELVGSADPWHREAYCVPCGERTFRDKAGVCHWCAGEREFKAQLAKMAANRRAWDKKKLKAAA